MDIDALDVTTYCIPTADQPESDGTLRWDQTTVVVVEARAGQSVGVGYTYCGRAAATVIADQLTDCVRGQHVVDVGANWHRMVHRVRNIGRSGVAACAISAVDIALWDLKANWLDLALVDLLGAWRREVPIYGSGGFCSYSVDALTAQLGAWVRRGIPRVKMKVGRDPGADVARVVAARREIGPSAELYVDANGAYGTQQALALADAFAHEGVSWLEEPVSSDDLGGLARVRARSPAGVDVAAGEYGYSPWYVEQMLAAGAVDVIQLDVSRCLGITGLLQAGAIAYGHHIAVSGHGAPAVQASALCALPNVRHLEYFWDHVRIEERLFDGVARPSGATLGPDITRPGLGLSVKHADMADYRQ